MILLTTTKKEKRPCLHLTPLLDLSMETGFVKRVRKFRAPAMTMVAMRTIISVKTWSETTIWDEYIDAVKDCGGERIEREVFHDHISKPASQHSATSFTRGSQGKPAWASSIRAPSLSGRHPRSSS